ncbi:MAG: hypothetical protein E6713_02995 [Sporomusaceae bacterium]|nr:hypothetical protein [Sporomusaceae bacterium]
MSYPSFPEIQRPSYSTNNEDIFPDFDKAVVASDSDGGYTTTRPRYTRSQMGNQYYWPAMPKADYVKFKTFVNSTIFMAGIFIWTDPETGEQKNVRLTDKPKAVHSTPNYWEVTMSIKEV